MKCPRCGKTLDGLRCNVCKLNIDTDELAIIGNKMRALSETIAGYVADQRKQAEDRKRAGQEAEGQKEASDREAAQRADNAISAIGPVSFSNECERTIKHARGVYDALADSQKAYVRKVKTLQNAEAKFESLRLDNIAAQKVIDMINTLGKDSYTEEFGRKISYTRLTYNNLSVPQRSLVSNYSKLTSAETDYDNLRKASEKREQSRKMIIRFCVAAAAVVVCIGGFALFKTGVFNGNQTRPLSEAFFGSAKQGDEFTLGKYEQDNNFENGAEDIEWVVVNNDVVNNENDMILAVSKYCLDNKAYNESESYASTDWEHCSLRQWLNDDFYNSSFTDDEKAWICATNLQNHDAEFYYLPGGDNTVDHVFLLSCGDIAANYDGYRFTLMRMSYNDDNSWMMLTTSNQNNYDLLKAAQTSYAKEVYIKAQAESWGLTNEEDARAQYAELEEEYGENASNWWLRTRGDNWYSNMVITWSGSALADPSQSRTVGVRPAIVISKNHDQAAAETSNKNDSSHTNSTSTPSNSETASEPPAPSEVNAAEQQEMNYPNQILYGDQQIHFVSKEGAVFRMDFSGTKFFDEWSSSDIVKIAASENAVVGLTSDGNVLISSDGTDTYGFDTLPFTDIADICICQEAVGPENDGNKGCIICLANDGTAYFVHADGYKAHEEDVQSISASTSVIAIAYKDGTVFWRAFDQNDYSDVQEWSDVVQVTCGEGFIAGLKSDGSVVVSGGYLPSALEGSKILLYDDDWTGFDSVKFNLSEWNGIVSISAGAHHLVGLKQDGTVVSAGLDTYGQCDTGSWTDILRIQASKNVTIGYMADGDYLISGKELLSNILDLEDAFTVWMGYTN